MPKCQFTIQYYDYETRKEVDFNCDEEELLASGFCVFHHKDYLQDETNYEEHKRKVLDRLKHKVNHAISNNEPLFCIGFHLPDFSLSDLNIEKEFNKPVYFSHSKFYGKAKFSRANFQVKIYFWETIFQGPVSFFKTNFQEALFDAAEFQEGPAYFRGAHFHGPASFKRAKFQQETDFFNANFEGEAVFSYAKFQGGQADFSFAQFQGQADFSEAKFKGQATFNNSGFYGRTYFSGLFNDKTYFNYVLFEGKEKVIFEIENLSNVSFMNTDLTGVRFSDIARWGGEGKKAKEDRFKIIDERRLEKEIKEKDGHTTKDFNLGTIKAVYRNLRENYEYRMRYDEAGQFFIREMELKRKYREVVSSKNGGFEIKVKLNNWLRRNFSLTGLYYNLFVYGEDLKRPALVLLLPLLILSTVYWGAIDSSPSFNNDSLALWFNATERTLFDMSQIERKEPHLVDTAIKTASLAILGTLLIPLRRKFERRFRH